MGISVYCQPHSLTPVFMSRVCLWRAYAREHASPVYSSCQLFLPSSTWKSSARFVKNGCESLYSRLRTIILSSLLLISLHSFYIGLPLCMHGAHELQLPNLAPPSHFTGPLPRVTLEKFHRSHHPWFFLDADGLVTAVIWLPEKGCVVCVYVLVCLSAYEKREWKNENRSFMAKSWKEQISPSASFPACMSLWLAKKEVHANTQMSQSSIVSIPIFIHFAIVCPTLHYGCAELQWLIASLMSTVLAHMDEHQTNENFLILWLQFYKGSVHFFVFWNESTYLALTTL